MKTIKWILALILLGVTSAGSAWADRGHWHSRSHVQLGVMIGPSWDPWYYRPYRYPYYEPYYPPVVMVQPQSPPVYIEQGGGTIAESSRQTNYWYYCNASRTYYPYVNECPGGWQRVVPQPPAP